MSEKNAVTLIVVAVIGAFGAILAACIGLIPTILPMVRATITPSVSVYVTATFIPSDTPLPETPTITFAPPTDTETSTLTATLSPLETPSETPTTVPTPAASSSNIDDYVGTWLNVDTEPASDKVKLVVTRIEVTKTGDTTANLAVCRHADAGEIAVLPDPAPATFYDFAMVARNFAIPRYPEFNWTILMQQSGEQIVATVQEYDANNILLNSDTFRLEKPNLIDSFVLQPCDKPSPTNTP
jgi:hypothetical protein